MSDTVVDASHLFLRRAIRLVPSADPWADAIAETIMARWPDAPDHVTEAWTRFALDCRDRTNCLYPSDLDWTVLWRRFCHYQAWATDEPTGGDAA